jgi:hypothetical protein
MIRCTALILLTLSIPSCVSPQHDERAKAESDILEAVFRYQFRDGPALLNNAAAYYIAINGRDPADEFTRRFEGHIPQVKKASLCRVGDGLEGVRDVKTDQRGLRFGVGSVKWIADTQVEVGGGYYKHGLNASGNTYYLTLQNGVWRVTQVKLLWMSQRDFQSSRTI